MTPLPHSSSTRRPALVLCALFAVLFFAVPLVARVFVVPTASMESTLLPGDHLIVRLSHSRPALGGLVVFRSPAEPHHSFIKRVTGLPGDRLHLVNKVLYRNGAPVSEPYAYHSTTFLDAYRDFFPARPNLPLPQSALEMLSAHQVQNEVVVPEGCLFVLGDNRDNSLDSRYFGFVRQADVQGVPLLVYWSTDPNGGTRWGRTFHTVH